MCTAMTTQAKNEYFVTMCFLNPTLFSFFFLILFSPKCCLNTRFRSTCDAFVTALVHCSWHSVCHDFDSLRMFYSFVYYSAVCLCVFFFGKSAKFAAFFSRCSLTLCFFFFSPLFFLLSNYFKNKMFKLFQKWQSLCGHYQQPYEREKESLCEITTE